MIADVDEALRDLVLGGLGEDEVDIAFDAPTREWSGRRGKRPTLNVYLYDIREDVSRRVVGVASIVEDGLIRKRGKPPQFYRLSYLVTAWTSAPEDEHRLLSNALATLLSIDGISLSTLGENGRPLPITVALPPPQDRSISDIWTALGGQLKPSLDLVVTTQWQPGELAPIDPERWVGVEDGVPFAVGRDKINMHDVLVVDLVEKPRETDERPVLPPRKWVPPKSR